MSNSYIESINDENIKNKIKLLLIYKFANKIYDDKIIDILNFFKLSYNNFNLLNNKLIIINELSNFIYSNENTLNNIKVYNLIINYIIEAGKFNILIDNLLLLNDSNNKIINYNVDINNLIDILDNKINIYNTINTNIKDCNISKGDCLYKFDNKDEYQKYNKCENCKCIIDSTSILLNDEHINKCSLLSCSCANNISIVDKLNLDKCYNDDNNILMSLQNNKILCTQKCNSNQLFNNYKCINKIK